MEDEDTLARIPLAYADHDNGRMRCDGNRCTALQGEIGGAATCLIYEVRPIVCRECQPGDDECLIARRYHNI